MFLHTPVVIIALIFTCVQSAMVTDPELIRERANELVRAPYVCCMAGNFCLVQNFVIFVGWQVETKF